MTHTLSNITTPEITIESFLENRPPESYTDVELAIRLTNVGAEALYPPFWAVKAHPKSLLLAAYVLYVSKVYTPNAKIPGQCITSISKLLGHDLSARICWDIHTAAIENLYKMSLASFLRQGNREGTVLVENLLSILGETEFMSKRCACCHNIMHKYLPLPSYYGKQRKKYCEQTSRSSAGGVTSPARSYRAEMVNASQYSCPYCGAADRERAYAIWMDRELPHDKAFDILEIAPSPALRFFIKNNFPNASYRSGDLYMDNVDMKLDIMNMHQIEDKSLDFFVCSHVLEHVRDDMQAMRELHRILRDTGRGILVVPMDLNQTFIDEDPDCTDIGERWRRFDQGDHVRKYSRQGWIERLRSVFDLTLYGKDFFGPKAMEENALLETSTLYVVSRKHN